MEEVSRLQALLCSSVPFGGSHGFQSNHMATLGDSSVGSALHQPSFCASQAVGQ